MRFNRALSDKQPEYNVNHYNVTPQHHNTRSLIAKIVKIYFDEFNFLSHTPFFCRRCSLYHLFRLLAHDLVYQHFQSYEEVRFVDKYIFNIRSSKHELKYWPGKCITCSFTIKNRIRKT